MLFSSLFSQAAHRWLLAGLAGLALAGTAPAAAQTVPSTSDLRCLLLPLAPALRTQQAALVVEAQVLDARSFWDAAHERLFTRHRLRVFSVLKGAVADTTSLVLLTEGGRLGLDQQLLTNTLRLTPGQQGVFFLTPAPWPQAAALAGRAWTPFGSEQGFIAYNPADGSASEPFRTYPAIDANFYKGITDLTKQPRRVLLANPVLSMASAAQRTTAAPTITGLAPQTLPAGAGAVLTITGSDFGASRSNGFVEFRNADDGGATRVQARPTDYLTWTNTRIQVRVPSVGSGGHPAGSGLVRVTANDQQAGESTSPLTVVYALTNVESTDATPLLQRPNHIAQNSHGGITFHFGPNFAVSPAVAPWQRALATWRCQTGMNWEVGTPNASNAIKDDGQNVVAFDAGAELPANVLGRTTSYYLGCYDSSGEVVFWVKEIDMQFDDATVFQFGPALAVNTPTLRQIDFETVAVHELGHAHQLNHLNLRGAVMHYGIAYGQNTRTLDPASDVAGGRQVLRVRSFRPLGCGNPALLPAPLTGFSAQLAGGGVLLNWATRDECFLSSFVVERSLSGDTLAWEPLGTVAARPPAAQYQYNDAQPPGRLLYYRLRLRRPDGTLDNVAPVLISTDGANASVSIFPNPVAGDQLRLQYPAGAAGAVVFRICDELGRQVSAVSVSTTAGLNVLNISLAGVRTGFYVLRWQDAQGGHGSRKFVRL